MQLQVISKQIKLNSKYQQRHLEIKLKSKYIILLEKSKYKI